MRVSQTGNSPVQGTEVSGANKTQKSAAAQTKKAERGQQSATPAATDGANPTISGRGKEMARAREVASKTPDVREDKVAALKKRIAEGSYRVDAEAIADRMVEDHLKTGIG